MLLQALRLMWRHCNSITTLKLNSAAVKELNLVLEPVMPSLCKWVGSRGSRGRGAKGGETRGVRSGEGSRVWGKGRE